MTDPDPDGYRIGFREIYEGLMDVKAALTRFEPTVKTVLDHESRLRVLERWRYALPSSLVLAALSVVVAITQGK